MLPPGVEGEVESRRDNSIVTLRQSKSILNKHLQLNRQLRWRGKCVPTCIYGNIQRFIGEVASIHKLIKQFGRH